MPIGLNELVRPTNTALVTMEVQSGTIGDYSPFPELVQAARRAKLIHNISELLQAGRTAKLPVVHCTASFRGDLRGSSANAPLLRAMTRRPDHILEGTDGSKICGELFEETYDIVCNRHHGVSPFTGTNLDATLRHCEVSTIIATGVSVNVAILGLVIEAVNLGYNVVLPLDCIAGFPDDYVEAVTHNTLSLLAVTTRRAELLDLLNSFIV